MKRSITIIVTALVCAALLAACGGKTSSGSSASGEKVDIKSKRFVATDSKGEFPTVENSVDIQSMLAKVQYIPEMFYGWYGIESADGFSKKGYEALKDFRENTSYWNQSNISYTDSTDHVISKLPFMVKAGKRTLSHRCYDIKGYEWMEMTYLVEGADTLISKKGAYEIIDNSKLKFIPLEEFDYNDETRHIAYKLSNNPVIYDFELKGGFMTLSIDGYSAKLVAHGFDKTEDAMTAEGYVRQDSPMIENFDNFKFWQMKGNKDEQFFILPVDGKQITNNSGYFDENGIFTFTSTDKDNNTKTGQYLYYIGGQDGMVFSDGDNNYVYTDSYGDRNASLLGNNITTEDLADLENITEDKIEEIVEKRALLLDELAKAFEDAGIDVNLDRVSGEVIIDSALLFPVDDASVSEDGKSFFTKFMNVYASVILKDTYEGFISGVRISGHTDSVGDYDYNLDLSKRRAESVKTFCLSDECTIDSQVKKQMESLIITEGQAYDELVRDANGNEDAAASRRVTISFIISLK